MAAPYGTVFKQVNVLANLTQWTLVNAEISGNNVVIHPGGYISYDLTNELNEGLKASKYRYLEVTIIDPQISETYDYQNVVEVYQDIVYSDANGNKTNGYELTPIVHYGSTYNDQTGEYTISSDLTMLDQNMDSDTIYIRNRTDVVLEEHDVTVTAVIMYRSNDLTGQLGNIGNQNPGQITQMQITCNRSNGTIDTILDSVEIECLFPDDMPPYNSIGDAQFRVTFNRKEGYPTVGVYSSQINPTFDDIKFPDKFTLQGVRDGVCTLRLTYYGSGEHYGEYTEKDISVINCDPGEIELVMGTGGEYEVNGFNGVSATLQMSPHPWYELYRSNCYPGPPFCSNLVAGQADLTRKSSIDGGYFTFGRDSDIGVINDVVNGSKVTLYGVWNGLQELELDASMQNPAEPTHNVSVITTIPISITNCEHDNILVADKELITSLDDSVTLTLTSDPTGAPLNESKQQNSDYGWIVPDVFTVVMQTGGNIRNPQIVLKPNMAFVGTVTVQVLANQQEYNVYSLVSKEIELNISIAPEPAVDPTISSSTGSFEINEYQGQIYLYVSGEGEDLTYSVTQQTVDGGTVTLNNYSTTTKSIKVTAEHEGKVQLIFNNTQYNVHKVVTLNLDYTDQLNELKQSLQVVTVSGKQEFNKYNEQTYLQIQGDLVDYSVSITQESTDNGSLQIGSWNNNNKQCLLTARNEGQVTLNIQIQFDWTDKVIYKSLLITNDYSAWLETVSLVPADGGSIIYDPYEQKQINIENFIQVSDLITPIAQSIDGGTLTDLSYNASGMYITVQGGKKGQANLGINPDGNELTSLGDKRIVITMDYTQWGAGCVFTNDNGDTSIAVGQELTFRMKDANGNIINCEDPEIANESIARLTGGSSGGTYKLIEGKAAGTTTFTVRSSINQGYGVVVTGTITVNE